MLDLLVHLQGDSAIIGLENLNGIKLAIQELNKDGKQFKLIVKDDKMDEKETITQYRQMVDIENVDYILTVTYGGFIALADQAEQDNIIFIDSLDASEEFSNLSNNAFAIGIYDESIGYTIADYLNEDNINKVGLISNLEDPFILLVKNAFKDKYSGLIKEEDYNFNDKDFRTILNKLSDYEYIILLGWEETGLIVKQTIELGMNTKFIGIDTFSSKNFRENTNNNYNGLLFTFWQGSANNPIYNQIITNYKTTFNKDPDNVLFVATGYDATMVLGTAIKNCDNNIECVKNRLKQTKDFKGATGSITIDQDGITRSTTESIHTYRNEEIVKII